jgi:hypothetical protein
MGSAVFSVFQFSNSIKSESGSTPDASGRNAPAGGDENDGDFDSDQSDDDDCAGLKTKVVCEDGLRSRMIC